MEPIVYALIIGIAVIISAIIIRNGMRSNRTEHAARDRKDVLERTREWCDAFVDCFVVSPTADVPDFATQSMPKLESLAILYSYGIVDREIIDRRIQGDLRNYALELQFYLLEHEDSERILGLPPGNDYPLLRSMFKINSLSNEAKSELVKLKDSRKEPLTSAEAIEHESSGETVVFSPNDELLRQYREIMGEDK